MTDARIANHQQFELLRCKLCNKLYEDPRLLPCLHSFCLPCLEKHISQTVTPSAEDMCCPLCQEATPLSPSSDLSAFPQNSLLTKYVTQAQRDATVAVAGREVLEMQRQALSETEQQCPEIATCMRKIADTASLVIANRTSDQSEVHGYDTVKVRQDLQSKIVDIQEQSLQIVYAIDKVNQDLEAWLKEKEQIREKIRQRSQLMQEMIINNEIRLLTKLDATNLDMKMKDECFEVKSKLHKMLKGEMTLVDFIKVLSEFGNREELEEYTKMVEERESKLTHSDITLMRNIFSFDCPNADIEDGVEMLFGTLSEITEEMTVWDPHWRNTQQTDINRKQGSPQSVTSGHLETEPRMKYSPLSSPPSSEDSQSNPHYQNPIIHEDHGVRFTKRFEAQSPQKTRRRPLKSMSFDTGASYSSYLARKTESHTQMMQSSVSQSHSISHHHEGHLIQERAEESHHEHTDLETTTESSESSHSSSGSGPMNSAMNTLSEASHFSDLSGQREWLRRLSAPTPAINELARRRLSALSILERANISTEGINMTNHVESGLTEARMEWLRENVRTRTRSRMSERSVSMDNGQIAKHN